MIFATSEFGFVKLADRHARASKVQPQKRNPFALAFIRAQANRLLGVQTQLAASARTPSAQMDNRLFSYEAAPEAVRSVADALRLMTECVDLMRFNEDRALNALSDRSVCASDLAEALSVTTGADHRHAQGVVGRLLRALEDEGRSLAEATIEDVHKVLREMSLPVEDVKEELLSSALDPTCCVASRCDVGGAALKEVEAMAEELIEAARASRQACAQLRAKRETALQRLREEAESFARGR